MVDRPLALTKEHDGSTSRLILDRATRLLEFRVTRYLPLLVLSIGLGVTGLLFIHSRNDSFAKLEAEFSNRVREKQFQIEQRLKAYEQVLRGAGALFEASRGVTLEEYRIYVASLKLEEHSPGIQGVGFSVVVPAPNEPARLTATPAENLPCYHPPPRDLCTSIIYLEPSSDRNLRAFGYDMYAEPVRRAAMQRARDSGSTAASGKVKLVQETDQDVQAGFLMYSPVYRGGVTPESVNERRSNLIGWTYAPFRMDDLMRGILGERSSDLGLAVFDGEEISVRSRMHCWQCFEGRSRSRFRSVVHVEIFGRSWTIILHSLKEFERHYDPRLEYAIAGGGVAVSSLMALILWLLVTGNARSLAIAEEREKRFKSVMFQANDSILMINRENRVVEANEHAAKLFGYPIPELLQMHLMELTAPESLGDIQAVSDQMMAAGQARFETRLRRKDGSIFSAEVSIRSVFLGTENLALSFIRDLSERLKAEEAVRLSEARLRGITDSARDGIIMMDPRGQISYWNPAAESILGYGKEEAIGKHLHKLLVPERYLQAHNAAFPEFLRSGRGKAIGTTVELPARHKDGREIAVDLSLSAILLDGAWHATGIIRDITERKRAESELWDATQRLTLAAQAGGVGIWDYDFVTKILVWDDQMFRLYGVVREQFGSAYEAWRAGIHPDDRQRGDGEIQLALRGIKDLDTEYRVVWRDGSVHSLRALATVQRNAAGQPLRMLGTNWDTTAQKQAADELRESNRQLAETTALAKELAASAATANAAKSEFLANMSHEIRTPMNGVIGMTGLLLDTDLTEEQHSYAASLHASGESLLGIINSILDFSKIEAGKLELESLDFDLASLLDDLAAALAVNAHGKGLELFSSTDPTVPTLLRGDPGRLRQILTNLLGNAIKFTTQGEVAVRVSLDHEDDWECQLRFSVRDTGMGIPNSKIAGVFDQFSQVETSTTRRFGGTGLGLAISKQLAEMMGGSIGVRSEEGRGSQFWFTARLCKQLRGTPAEPHPCDLGGIRALIVADNASSRELLTALLDSWGMRTAQTEDCAGALQALHRALEESDPFQVAIVDRQIPDRDGEAIGCAIRADEKLADTRLVLLTSQGVARSRKRVEESGFASCVSKPVRRGDLFRRLSRVLVDAPAGDLRSVPDFAEREELKPFAGVDTRILIAEDNVTNQEVALGILNKLGLCADVVCDGGQAVEALQSLRYGLVLMDMRMPVMDGLEATRRIRGLQSGVLDPSIPIIAMTANAMQSDRERCLEAGMNGFVSKPVSPQALLEALQRWIRVGTPVARPQPAEQEAMIYNRDKAMKRMMGDQQLASRVMEAFLGDIPQQIRALQVLLEKGDASASGRRAHSIKGAAANVGGERLQGVAALMEKAADRGDLGTVSGAMANLEEEFRRLSQKIREQSGPQEGVCPVVDLPVEGSRL